MLKLRYLKSHAKKKNYENRMLQGKSIAVFRKSLHTRFCCPHNFAVLKCTLKTLCIPVDG